MSTTRAPYWRFCCNICYAVLGTGNFVKKGTNSQSICVSVVRKRTRNKSTRVLLPLPPSKHYGNIVQHALTSVFVRLFLQSLNNKCTKSKHNPCSRICFHYFRTKSPCRCRSRGLCYAVLCLALLFFAMLATLCYAMP